MKHLTLSRRRVLGVGAGSLVGAALVAGCSASAAPAATSSSAETSASGQQVTVYVFRGDLGIKGPDGKAHDAIVPSSFVVKAGVPVQLTAINYDDGSHTMTAPDLGLNLTINPGKAAGDAVQPVTTTATFTASKKGIFHWFCTMACDDAAGGWAMTAGYGGQSQDGFMAGSIVVI